MNATQQIAMEIKICFIESPFLRVGFLMEWVRVSRRPAL